MGSGFKNNELGKRLKEVREAKGLSADDFSELTGVGKTTQYNYEKGLRVPDAEYFHHLFHLGCDIQYVICGVSIERLVARNADDLMKKIDASISENKKIADNISELLIELKSGINKKNGSCNN